MSKDFVLSVGELSTYKASVSEALQCMQETINQYRSIVDGLCQFGIQDQLITSELKDINEEIKKIEDEMNELRRAVVVIAKLFEIEVEKNSDFTFPGGSNTQEINALMNVGWWS